SDQKLRTRCPPLMFLAGNPQPGLVNQGRRLQRLSRALMGHLVRCQPAQLFVNQRKQIRCGLTSLTRRRVVEGSSVVHSVERQDLIILTQSESRAPAST